MQLLNFLRSDQLIKVRADATLISTLSKLATSHDAAFVFDTNDQYLGVINPYHCIIKASFPANARVNRCLFHPPNVRLDVPISKLAQLFIESKVHYIPVVDNKNNFIGIISARRLLWQFRNSPLFRVSIFDYLKTKQLPLITIYEEDLISTALNLFKSKKISKLVVINNEMKLKGILSYYDLISYLVRPRTSIQYGQRIGDKINFYHYRVKNFVKSYVLTLTGNHNLTDALNLILDKRIGSIVVIDQLRHPIGIITTRDLLSFFLRRDFQTKVEFVSKNLSKKNRQILGSFF